MVRKTTSLKIESELWKEVKKHCIDKEMDISEYIEYLVQKDLGLRINSQKRRADLVYGCAGV